jgi:hygromycin-B 7''-O-kinase
MAPLLPTLTAAEYSAAHPRTELWLPAVQEVARRHGLKCTSTRFGEGSMIVFAVGAHHVVKFYPPHCADKYVRERAALACIRGRVGFATPEVVAEGEVEGWPYLVMTRLSGVPIDKVWGQLSEAERLRLASEAGEAVARLHALPSGNLQPLAIEWGGFIQRQSARCVERQRSQGVAEPWLDQIPEYLESTRAHFPSIFPAVLLHTELGPGHLYLLERAGRWELEGLIDFADAMVGPPEYDFAAVGLFITRGDPRRLRAFLLAYGYTPGELTPALRERLMAYTLLHRYSNLRWYLEQVPPAPATRTLARLAMDWWSF